MANKNSKTIEEELIDRSSYLARDVAEVEVSNRYDKFETTVVSKTGSIQESFQHEVEQMNLNLHGTVYFLMTCQLLVSFVMLLILDLFQFILSLILMLIILVVIVIYCISYCMISRYPEKFKKASSCIVIWVILAVCEALVLCFLSIPISTRVFLLEVSMVIASLFVGFIAARVKKENFNERMALACVHGTSLVFYVIWMVSFNDYLWLTLCTAFVLAYEIYLVKEINKACLRSEQEDLRDRFTAGLYVCILMFKSKVELFFKVMYWIYEKTCKKKEENVI